MQRFKTVSAGQTLIEMIVIVGVVTLLVTGIVVGTTVSLARSQTAQTRSIALSYAQQGIELARQLRDQGWAPFAAMGVPRATYCLGTDGQFVVGLCTGVNMDNLYTRDITMEFKDASGPGDVPKVLVTSLVAWGDTTDPKNAVSLSTFLTEWR